MGSNTLTEGRDMIYDFLKMFDSDKNWRLPDGVEFDAVTVAECTQRGLIEVPHMKGATYTPCLVLKLEGRLLIKRQKDREKIINQF